LQNNKPFFPLPQPKWLYGLLLVLFIIAVAVQANIYLSWDVSWLTQASKKFLQGGNYTQDFFGMNPPLIIWLYIPPVLLSELLHITIIWPVRLYTLLISALSLGLSYSLIKRIVAPQDRFIQYVFILALALVFWIAPSYEFGQREHLMLMLVFPYLLSTVLLLRGQRVALNWKVIIGVLAALGFGLKPYFLLTWIIVEIYLAITLKSIRCWFRLENWLILLLLAFYLLLVYWLTPDYYQQVLPLAVHYYSQAARAGWAGLLLNHLSIICILAPIITLLLRKELPYKQLIIILLLALGGFYCGYLWQGKAWYYHIYPAFALAILVLIMHLPFAVMQAHAQRLERPFYYNLLFFIVFLLLVFYPLGAIVRANIDWISCYYSPQCSVTALVNFTKARDNNNYFYVFSTTVTPWPIVALYAHKTDARRFPSMWFLPGLVHTAKKDLTEEQRQKMLKLADKLRNMVVEDFKRYQPQLVFIDISKNKPYMGDMQFDYLSFFLQSNAMQRIWQQYQYLTTVQGYAVYIKK
jgi:hypothetical protein